MRTKVEINNRIEELKNIIYKKDKEIREDYNEITNMYQNYFADIAINDITTYQVELNTLQWVLQIESEE